MGRMTENQGSRRVLRRKIIRAAQLEVLEAVSDAFESVVVDEYQEDVILTANRRLKEDGHPFKFTVECYRVIVREVTE